MGELVENVPSVPDNRILGIDGYGNLKTNIQFNNDIQSVEINGVEKSICTGSGIFDIQDGSLVLAPGSSGWQGNYFVEICLRGGSASKLFNNPKPGDIITLK